MAPLKTASHPAPSPVSRLPGISSPARRLVVNADDFGRSPAINAAVLQAHREGILTTASLMVNEPGMEEAVELVRHEPGLGVGLHLTLLCGRAALPDDQIPGLVHDGCFTNNPVQAGWRYFAHGHLRDQLRAEIHEQFARFQRTGLTLDHVNGHLHLHLHPTVFGILMEDAAQLGITRLRLTSDPLLLNWRLSRGRWVYRLTHWLIYRILARRAQGALRRRAITHTANVFGLLQNARVDEAYVTGLLAQLPAGDSELYSHPSVDEFSDELAALISPRVRTMVEQLGIRLVRYQDL